MKTREFSARVDAVLVGRTPNTLLSTPQEAVQVSFEGFEGDLHAGLTRGADSRTPYYPRGTQIRNSRQVSIVALEELAEVAACLNVPEVRPEWLGANLLFSGLPRLSLLPPSTRLFFSSGAVLVVDSENPPCAQPGQIIQTMYPLVEADLVQGFRKHAQGLRGIVAWVERPGAIRTGDAVRANLPRRLVDWFTHLVQEPR